MGKFNDQLLFIHDETQQLCQAAALSRTAWCGCHVKDPKLYPTAWCGCHIKDPTLSPTAWCGCHVKDSKLPPTVWCGCHVKDCTLSHTAWYGCHVKDHCAAKPSRAWWRRGRNLDQEELWEIFIVLEESPPRPISFFLKNYFPLSFFSCKSRSEQRPISFLI